MEQSAFLSILILGFFGLLALILIYSSVLSYIENEKKAGLKLLGLTIPIIALGYFASFQNYELKLVVAISLSIITLIMTYLLFKKPIQSNVSEQDHPTRRFDEHDVIFARMRLKASTPDWEQYYSNHKYEEEQDNKARSLAGLLNQSSLYYNPLTYNSSNANFDIIEYLHKAINHPTAGTTSNFDKVTLTRYIKGWAKYLGVHSIGITELKDYHLYTVKGRGKEKGKPIVKNHKFAIAFTVEMDYTNVSASPASPTIFESTQKYLDCAIIALQFSTFLKNAGYDTRAHIDGDYELICPLVARDAGLGEIGRMGLLMTPDLGPRVRIAVVTTNASLLLDGYNAEPTMIEFCKYCKKCADCCPGKSIPHGDMIESNGMKRWKINSESCYQFWCVAGTDCGRCMSVCPFSHPNNLLHNVIRRLIRRSFIMARLAYIADDLLYDRKPKPKPIPNWMKPD
ncbi:MAG: hypothetical protein EHM93_11470 [Bacteroidales bacterium]|nr:MAG: hypothetical protein EHM93_11470 [Bacteroidales bacterium]